MIELIGADAWSMLLIFLLVGFNFGYVIDLLLMLKFIIKKRGKK